MRADAHRMRTSYATWIAASVVTALATVGWLVGAGCSTAGESADQGEETHPNPDCGAPSCAVADASPDSEPESDAQMKPDGMPAGGGECAQWLGSGAAASEWVYANASGKLEYKTLPKGDRIMDFSFAGY